MSDGTLTVAVSELHTCLRIIDCHIPNGELLIARPHAVFTPGEDEVY